MGTLKLDFSDIKENCDINLNQEFSCNEMGNSGGKMLSGINFFKINQKDKKSDPKIKSINCKGVKVKDYNHNNNIIFDSSIDCELVPIVNGYAKCPNNKFIKSYHPNNNKISCCYPSQLGKGRDIILEGDLNSCENVNLDKNGENILQCPNDKLATDININNNIKLKCCGVSLAGTYGSEIMNMNNKCKQMGILKCNNNNVKKYESICTNYGLKKCNTNEIDEIERKCDKYGMRYLSKKNVIHNPECPLLCHQNNFEDLDKYCKENNIDECNWKNINEQRINDIKDIKNNIDNLDKKQKICDGKIKYLEKKPINLLVWIAFGIIFLIIICFFIFNRKQINKINDILDTLDTLDTFNTLNMSDTSNVELKL